MQKENLTMKKLILALILSIIIPFTINSNAERENSSKELKEGFVAVDLMDTYQIDLTPNADSKNDIITNDPKVLFLDVDIMKLKLNYEFKNTESALKSIKPK